MADTTAQLDTQITALATEAFSAFCEDITGMFGVSSECTEIRTGSGTFEDLKKDFKKLVSINYVDAKGVLEGNFNLMFDQAGTFIIAGVFVMLPEKRIQEYVTSGTTKDTDFINDAIKEVGNLLVGSWDRVYREELPGHEHFKQSGTFVGNITEKSDDDGFSLNEECFYAVCQMEIDNFSKFKCAAVFPKSILEPKPEPEAEAETEAEPDTSEEENAETTETVDADDNSATADSTEEAAKDEAVDNEVVEEAAVEEAAEETTATEADTEKATEPEADNPPEAEANSDSESTGDSASQPETAEDHPESAPVNEPTASAEDVFATPPQPGPVTQAIEQLTSQAPMPLSGSNHLGSVTAQQIMNPAVLWADPEDTIEHLIKQMQQHNAGYLLVGKDMQIEGIASRSDIAAAVSPYTRSVFSHWRRPLDDASLQIRIKWFMSRPVQTIAPDANLDAVIHAMSKHGVRALPVVDANGQVMGLITVFDIFQILTGKDSLQGQTRQTPPLV